MRMIDADALRDNLQALAYDDWNQGVTTSWADAYSEFADMIEEMPTIERKTGIWRRAEYGYTCNQCGKTHLLRTAYCPSCGAEMDF